MPKLEYEGNPKHKKPWQPGRRGSLCPPQFDIETATELLEGSEASAGKRYATRDGIAYAAQEHRPSVWHGYPVAWSEVPETFRRRWLSEGKVSRSEIRARWREL